MIILENDQARVKEMSQLGGGLVEYCCKLTGREVLVLRQRTDESTQDPLTLSSLV